MHGFAFGEFVDEFVEIADLLDEGIGELFDTVAANGAGDEGGVGRAPTLGIEAVLP